MAHRTLSPLFRCFPSPSPWRHSASWGWHGAFGVNRIERGERIAIHGPSGCGKTTILRLLAGFAPPDEGVVRIAARDVAANGKILVEPESRNLGMVFQDLALWPHLTVYENLEFALKAKGLATGVRKQRINEALARVRLEDSGNAYPSRLSGGQQQRV